METRFSDFGPVQARLALAGLLVLAAILLVSALTATTPDVAVAAGQSDLDFYEGIIAALRAGLPYYPTLHEGLLAGDYPTLSLFNWRTPVYLQLLALFPSNAAAQVALGGLVLAAWLLGALAVYRLAGPAWALASLATLGLGLLSVAAPRVVMSFEFAGGVLILVSIAAHGLRLRWLGIAALTAALFIRELAAPAVLVAVWLSWRDRRWGEVGTWMVILALYAAYFSWHAGMAMAQLGDAERTGPGWLAFGGADFVLASARFNGVFLLLPAWATALALPLALVGLAGWRRGGRAFTTAVAFVLLFCVVGRPMNDYWGSLYTPLLMLGLPFAAPALADLTRAAGRARVRSPRSS